MATLTNDGQVTNGNADHLPQNCEVASQLRPEDIAAYLSEALKLTLGATQEELEENGGPLAQSEAAATIDRFQTFLVGSRTAFYAQQVEGTSQQEGEIR